MEAKKVVLKLQVHDEKEKKKALKKVSGISGIESISMDMNEKKLTVIGKVDPIQVAVKLRKHWYTEILTTGPAKEPQNKPDDQNKDDDKKRDEISELMWRLNFHYNYDPYYKHYYYNRGGYLSAEENPNSCVIC